MAHLVMKAAGSSVVSASLSRQIAPPKCSIRKAAFPSVRGSHGFACGRQNGVVARGSVIAAAKIEKVTADELEVAIMSRETTLLVDFYATWCGPCLLLARELEQVNERLQDKVKIVKVDVDENPGLSNMLKIQGLPTLVVIPRDNGKPAMRTEGLLPADQIMEIIEQVEGGKSGQQAA